MGPRVALLNRERKESFFVAEERISALYGHEDLEREREKTEKRAGIERGESGLLDVRSVENRKSCVVGDRQYNVC